MDDRTDALSADLCRFIDAAPSPFHACEEIASRLTAAGFRELDNTDRWTLEAGGWYTRSGGMLLAFWIPDGAPAHTPFRIVGAHTDSPNLRVKPRPDKTVAGFRQVGVEVYGGVLLNSWLDRDLGLSGRVFLEDPAGTREQLFLVDRPVMRVPQLAIHLDREVNAKGLLLNKQRHMAPIWSLEAEEQRDFKGFLASELDVDATEIIAWDAMVHDLTPSRRIGANEEMIAAPRLDNLASCFMATHALLDRLKTDPPKDVIPVLSFFDHEEIGSQTQTGADGQGLADLTARIVAARGGDVQDLHRAKAASICVSADMAHATHPNYPEKHDPEHTLQLNAGPVIKINANQRYATNASTEAFFARACEQADVPHQRWVMRTDLACGSTIGPLTAAMTGIATVDVGISQLSMHSAREMCGTRDPAYMIRALTACFA